MVPFYDDLLLPDSAYNPVYNDAGLMHRRLQPLKPDAAAFPHRHFEVY